MRDNSSLDLLIEINQSERRAQLSHFDSLDTKAGLVLGFASVLIALGNASASPMGFLSIIAPALAAATAVTAFWPLIFLRSIPSVLANTQRVTLPSPS